MFHEDRLIDGLDYHKDGKYEQVELKGSLKSVVQRIHEIMKDSGISGLDGDNLSALKKVVFETDIPEDEWRPLVFYHQGRYARNLVDQGNGNFDLLLVSWMPSHSSCIHDHAGSHCLMKILEGSIEETVYETPRSGEETLRVKRSTVLVGGESTYVHDKIGLHRIFNPSDCRPAVSLHLYSPPILKCHQFDERTAEKILNECPIDSYLGVPVTCRPKPK